MGEQLDASIEDPHVAVVVLNWNGWIDTIACLESLLQIRYRNYSVIVVDNGSTDDSVKRIREYTMGGLPPDSRRVANSDDNGPFVVAECTPNQIDRSEDSETFAYEFCKERKLAIIENNANLGFAGGNNMGVRFAIRHMNPDYVMLLNNDTVVSATFLKELVDSAEEHKSVNIFGPKILYYDSGGRNDIISSAGGGINWWLYPGYYHLFDGTEDDELHCFHGIRECDWITGAAMMVRKNLLNKNLLDEGFFFGCEDVDFCLNQKEIGGKTIVCLDSVIWHKVGAARNKSSRGRIRPLMAGVKSNFELTIRHNKRWIVYLLVHMVTLAVFYCKILIGTAIHSNSPAPWSQNLLRLLR